MFLLKSLRLKRSAKIQKYFIFAHDLTVNI